MVSAKPPASNQQLGWRRFLRPSWLAGVISVGFHSVLFAAGPTFPGLGFSDLVEPEQAAEKRNVPLVELTAAEQARLPDFSNSLYNFDAFSDLEPLDPLFSGQSSPDDSESSDEENLPSPFSRTRSFPVPSASIPFGITSLDSRSRPRRSPLPSASGTTAASEAKPNNTEETENAESSNATAPDNEPSADDLIAPLPGQSEDGTEIAVGSDPSEVMTLEELLQAYTYDAANTESEDIQARFDEWLEAGRTFAEELDIDNEIEIAAADLETEASENSVLRELVELPIDYEQQLCLSEEPQKGLIGAWVSPDGELLGEPEVLQSTGYAGLNQQAIRYIKTLDFSTVETFTGYRFEVVVSYDPENCREFGGRNPAAGRAGAPSESEAAETPEPTAETEDTGAADKAPEKEDADVENRIPFERHSAEDADADRSAEEEDAATEEPSQR